MKSTKSNLQSLKEKLLKQSESVKYFTPETLEIILNDRIKAAEIAMNGGNVQEFYKGSATSQTDFYKKNSSAYCILLELLAEIQREYKIKIKVENYGGYFTETVRADNETQAKYKAIAEFYNEKPEFRNGGKIAAEEF